jgi:hypothetical protein
MVARERRNRSKTLFACRPCFNQPIERLNNIFVLGARQFRRETLSEPACCRWGTIAEPLRANYPIAGGKSRVGDCFGNRSSPRERSKTTLRPT